MLSREQLQRAAADSGFQVESYEKVHVLVRLLKAPLRMGRAQLRLRRRARAQDRHRRPRLQRHSVYVFASLEPASAPARDLNSDANYSRLLEGPITCS